MHDAIVVCAILSICAMSLWGSLYFFQFEGIFSTFLVFCVGATVYFSLIPIELWLRGVDSYWKGGNVGEFNGEIPYVLVQSFLALPMFFFGLMLGGYKGVSRNMVRPGVGVTRENLIRLAVIVLVFATVYRSTLLSESDSYFNVAKITWNNPFYSLTKYSLMLCICVVGAGAVRGGKLVGWGLMLLPAVVGIATHDKNPILMSLIAILTVVAPRIRNALVAFLTLIMSVPIIFVLLILVRSFSYLRADFTFLQSVSMALDEMTVTRIDPAGPYFSILYYLNHSVDGWPTYLQSISQLVPKSIYPDRPPELAETFAKLMIEDWEEGRGLGFSPMAEAFINFGYFACLHFLIVGTIWALVWRIIYSIWVRFFSADLFECFYKIFGFYLLVLSFRTTSLIYIKILPMYAVCGMLILVAVGMLKKGKGREDSLDT